MFTIEDLRNGKCAVINDGTLEELKAVLKSAFPNDCYKITKDTYNYGVFQKHPVNDEWVGMIIKTKIPTQSVKEFYKQLQPQFEVGKWYKEVDSFLYIKYSKEDDNYIYSNEVVCQVGFRQIKNEFWTKVKTRQWILCEDLSKIQQYLPDNHPDKIITMKQYLTRKQLIELHKADDCKEWKSIIGCYLNLLVLEHDDYKVEIKQHDIDLANRKCSAKQIELLLNAGIILKKEIAVCDSKDGDCIETCHYYYINTNDNIVILDKQNPSIIEVLKKNHTLIKLVKGELITEPLTLQIKIN